ncbi:MULTISPECIES: universal stress protein [Streptomyces]|uniref:universal stress protein n=1 Tax=Streptomyces TaxID=1883 RepID=UPI000A394385|nr:MULTISPECIES: universal stress protein [Streptomyces]MDX3637129.1 universal stress protein [Streptomyces europaeiscabiei]MDX3655273.1 universal stress protein [Streptomyces europaeiscabiei]WRZ53629.1 universal stress protein [Streptomyces sp. NBC_01314]
MLRHITTGIDGSAESLAAAHWAAREAVRRGVALNLVHAWTLHPRPAPFVPADRSERGWAEETLHRAAGSIRAAHPGLRIVERLVRDSAVDALLTEAEETELLVLGSRGLGGVAGFMTGSVSQRVIARSTRPVVLVRAGDSSADEHLSVSDGVAPDEIPETPYRDVVLGLDTQHPCDELIDFAFTSARRRNAALHVIHAFSAPPFHVADGGPVPPTGPELLAAQEHSVVAVLRPWCEKYPEVRVTETVSEGRAATALVRASAGASLVVVGRRPRDSRLGPHVGAVTHAVLHHVGCPVAVVPHD